MPTTMGLRSPEVRTYPTRLSTLDTDVLTELSGQAVPYGVRSNVGWYLEEFAPGAFGASIDAAGPLPLLLWHNNRSWSVGAAAEWSEDDAGLSGLWRLDASPEAQRAARQARDGFMTGLSVGFQPIRSEWTFTAFDDWNPEDPATFDRVVRHEARLIEVSLTPTPAYPDAQVTLVRTAERRRNPRTPRLATPGTVRRGLSTPVSSAATPSARPDTPALDRWRSWRATV